MLSIYTDRSLIDDKKFVYDCEAFFQYVRLRNDTFTKEVLNIIESGEYQDEETFKDRFGRCLFVSCLSTTSKILLLLNYNKEYVFNGIEMGYNGVQLLSKLNSGSIFLLPIHEFYEDFKNGCIVNGRVCMRLSEINSSM